MENREPGVSRASRSGGHRRWCDAGLCILTAACLLAPVPRATAQTLCTITINSSDEKSALQQSFPRATFVELTTYGSEGAGGSDWLPRACQAGVSCDLLLISGHFAKAFFGDSHLDLPLCVLERRACERTCDAVLKRPRLVFLFGCNTLATKDNDQRTPEQFRQVLLADRLDPDFVERVVALRYSPLGGETRTRMRRVFGDEALVFGFSSVGPIGSVARPLFDYFLRTNHEALETTLAGATPAGDGLRGALERSWLDAFSEFRPGVVHGGEAPGEEECAFTNPAESRVVRLGHAEHLLSADPLRYAPIVWDFLRTQTGWDADEAGVMQRIAANAEARRDVLDALPHITDSLDVYFSMLEFADFVGWLDDTEVRHLRDARLLAILRDGVSARERDFLCAHPLDYVPSPRVLAANRGRLRFVETLPCISARGPEVRNHLLGELRNPQQAVRIAALDALSELEMLGPGDAAALSGLYETARGDLRASLLWGLATADGADVLVQRLVATASMDPDADVAWAAAKVLERLRTRDVTSLRSLSEALARPEGFLRRTVAVVLASLAPCDAQLLHDLRPYREDADEIVRASIAHLYADALTCGLSQLQSGSQNGPSAPTPGQPRESR